MGLGTASVECQNSSILLVSRLQFTGGQAKFRKGGEKFKQGEDYNIKEVHTLMPTMMTERFCKDQLEKIILEWKTTFT